MIGKHDKLIIDQLQMDAFRMCLMLTCLRLI